MTIRVVVTDKAVTLSPTHLRRGSTAIFLLSNLTKTSRVLAVGDASLTHRTKGTGFAVKLARNAQTRKLLYLTYRGPLPLTLTPAARQVQGRGHLLRHLTGATSATRPRELSAAARPEARPSSARTSRS